MRIDEVLESLLDTLLLVLTKSKERRPKEQARDPSMRGEPDRPEVCHPLSEASLVNR